MPSSNLEKSLLNREIRMVLERGDADFRPVSDVTDLRFVPDI